MSRALMSATVADQAGNAIQGAVVDVYETGTTTPVADLFVAASGGSPVATLTSDARGHVEGWFTVGRLVDLKVTDNGHTAYRPASPSIHLTFADFTITVAALAVSTDLATQAALDAEAALRVAGDAASQPLDSDLTAIAALSTTSYGRALLVLADAAAGRTAFGLGTAAVSAVGDFQPIDSDLTAIAALTTTSYGRAFLALADAAAGRTALGLGTAAVAASTAFDAAGAAAAAQAASQPVDSDLTAIAALSTTSFGRSFLALADAAAGRTLLGLGTAATTDSTAYAPLPSGTPTLGQAPVVSTVSPLALGWGSGSGNGLPANVLTKTANYTAVAGDFVQCDVSGGGFTITLPAAPATGALVSVKKIDASGNTLTIVASGGGTTDGDASTTTITKNAGAVFEHVGSNVWKIVASMLTTGPQGPTGATGATGTTGATGATGAAGSDGGSTITANTQTASYTAVLADAGKVVEMNNASANTFTIPPNSSVAFPVGTIIEVFQLGAGQTTITPGVGVTFRGAKTKTTAQYSTAGLRQRATDEWVLSGDLAS